MHVPAAWMALMVYAMMAVASVIGLVWRHPLAEIAARAAAPIGAAFTAVALFTGSVWGKPMWGTFWVWDARLTSVLILLFLYLGYIALHDAFDDPSRGARAASILCLVGSVNLPIIKFSVDWWNTLHQPSSILRVERPGGAQQHAGAAAGHVRRVLVLLRRGAYSAHPRGADRAQDPQPAPFRRSDRLMPAPGPAPSRENAMPVSGHDSLGFRRSCRWAAPATTTSRSRPRRPSSATPRACRIR